MHPYLPVLASCAADKSVRIYSLTSFTLLSTISGGHKRAVRSCAWKPGLKGESTLATASFDSSVGVWRRDDEQRGAVPTIEDGEEQNFTGFGGDTGNLDEEEDEEWRFALVLDGHESEVKTVAWSAGGNFLATCSRDKSVWIWEEVGDDDFETIAVLQEHSADVKYVCWHPEEEMLASASYDDDIRLWREDVDDWGCIAVLLGHKGTVWMTEWEDVRPARSLLDQVQDKEEQKAWLERREKSGPRLVSCSDDRSIRIWRRRPKEKGPAQNTMSIIRTGSNEEDWIEEAKLPKRHERAIYSISWSKRSGRIVSTGGDGRIIVYEERWKKDNPALATEGNMEINSASKNGLPEEQQTKPIEVAISEMGVDSSGEKSLQNGDKGEVVDNVEATEWIVLAEIDSTHGVYEVNHVIWAKRADRARLEDNEEVIVSTGDDGIVKVWTLS